MDRHVGLDLVRITEAAALACARWMGRGDKNAADQAAVTAMRKAFDNVDIRGTVVIGEGERDEAPMLYIGEQVGSGWGPEVDIALDPLECTNSVAYGRPNAMSVIALAARGHFLHAPDTYMEKIAVGPAARNAIDLRRPIEQNLEAVAAAKGYHLDDLTVVVLDRPRHEELIQKIRRTGARIHLIPDGDVSAAIATALDSTGVDILVGTGGAPEGVLAAAALRCLGGSIQGRLMFRSDEERGSCEEDGNFRFRPRLWRNRSRERRFDRVRVDRSDGRGHAGGRAVLRRRRRDPFHGDARENRDRAHHSYAVPESSSVRRRALGGPRSSRDRPGLIPGPAPR